MSSASSLQDAVAQKLQYYMTIKRREEDFDSSTRGRPSSSRVLLLANPQPMVSYSQMKDRSLKHYFTSPMIRSQIAKLEAMPPGTEREKKVKSTVVRKMKNRRASVEDLSLVDPEIRAEAYKAQLQALKILRRNTSSRYHRQMDGGGKLSRKMLSPNLSKGEASRIVDHASQILVATETVAIAQEILDNRYSPGRKHRPQSAPPVHIPKSKCEPSYGHTTKRERKRRPNYCWDINGRKVAYRKGSLQRPGSATSEYSTSTFDDSDSEMLHSRHPMRPMSAKERPYRHQQNTRQILRDRPYSADALYLGGYGKAMPSDSRRGFAIGNYVYAMDMATQTVQDTGMQTDLSMIMPQPPSDIRKYYIEVTTGSRAAAGTKADVYVVLQGKERRSDEIFLTETVTGSRPFKRGQIDIFMIETENVGQLVRLGIGHDQEEKDFSWYVVSVEVKSGSRSWKFPCNQWLSGCLQNKSTFVFLKPEIASSDSARWRHSTRSRSNNSSITDTSLSSGSTREPGMRQRQTEKEASSRSSSRSSGREQSRKRSHRTRKTSSHSSSSHQSSRRKSDSSQASSKKKQITEKVNVPVKPVSTFEMAARSTNPKVQNGSDIEYSSDHSKDDSERIVESIVEESADSDSSESSTITDGSLKEADDVIKDINAMNKPTESNSSFSEPDPVRQRRRGSLFENLKEQSSSESEKVREKIIVKTRKSSSSSSSSDNSQNSFFNQKISHASPVPEDTIQPTIIQNESVNDLSNEVTTVKFTDENMQKTEKSIEGHSSSSSSDSEKEREQKLKLLTAISIEVSSSDSSSESEIEETIETEVVIDKEQSIQPQQEEISVVTAEVESKTIEDFTITPTMYPAETHESSSSSSSSSSHAEQEFKVESTLPDEKVLEAPVNEEFPTSLSMAFPLKQPDIEASDMVGEEQQVASPQQPETVDQPTKAKHESSSSSISEDVDLLSSSSSSEEEDLISLPKVQTGAEEYSDVKEDVRLNEEAVIIDNTAIHPQLIQQDVKSHGSDSDSETLVSSGESGEELSSTSSEEDEPAEVQPSQALEKEPEKPSSVQLEPVAPMPIMSDSPRPQEPKASFNLSMVAATARPLSVTADVHEPTSESSSSSTSSSSDEEDYVLDGSDIYQAIMNDDIDRIREILMRHPTIINNALDNEQTALQYAATHGKTRPVKVLLENNADYKAENKAGYTAIHLAARNGHLQIVQIMVSFGVNLESQNIEGQTPLHVAAMSGKLDVVKWLALNGANVKAKDMGGRSAIALAKQNHHEDIVTFLTNYMRKKNIPMESSSSEGSLLSSTSSSSSSSSESEEERQQTAPRRSVVEALAEREQEELMEKKRIYEQQHSNMQKRRISFLDEIRMENE